MKITVQYEVPVYVEVDTDTNTVERVVVDDESVSINRNAWETETENVTTADLEAGDINRAYAIAESAAWPSWRFGW